MDKKAVLGLPLLASVYAILVAGELSELICDQLSPAEEQAILACHSNIDQTQANGIRANGEKYLVFQANGRSVYGKKAVRSFSCNCIASSDYD